MAVDEGLDRPMQPASVLLVDDDGAVLEAYRRVLANAEFFVTTAVDGKSAIAELGHTHFDVILSDIAMPGIGGLAFLRAVREHDLDVPVLLMTGQPEIETAVEAIEYGAFRYLIKPIEHATLIAVVRHATHMHSLAKLKRKALEIVGREGHLLGDCAALEVRFRNALQQLWIAYQPIVSWKKRTVFGYEALVRSEEPTLQNPAELFAVAERLGRLHDLGRAVRASVAAAGGQVPQDSKLFVNVHPDDLNDPDLLSEAAPLSLVAPNVVLELTERSSLDGIKDVQGRTARLRELGFRICVDDLGAGYAGLSSFIHLEPDVVKLDMSLVRGIDKSSRKRSVVQSMLQLAARELGMLVICEGVETAAERDALAHLGADLLQGYLFARPNRRFVTPNWGV